MLAAFCILTVRGSVINLGFLLQAKEVILGQRLSSWNWSTLVQQYPDSVAISAFFAAFGLIIALMKDTPDVAGDTKNNIPTFSVRLGAKKMFG
jgi:homogentisate phytyltransferase/homogentisate geranylgeranyltransferase